MTGIGADAPVPQARPYPDTGRRGVERAVTELTLGRCRLFGQLRGSMVSSIIGVGTKSQGPGGGGPKFSGDAWECSADSTL